MSSVQMSPKMKEKKEKQRQAEVMLSGMFLTQESYEEDYETIRSKEGEKAAEPDKQSLETIEVELKNDLKP